MVIEYEKNQKMEKFSIIDRSLIEGKQFVSVTGRENGFFWFSDR